MLESALTFPMTFAEQLTTYFQTVGEECILGL